MALPNDKRALQDRLSRVATRMALKFGASGWTGATGSGGIPVSVLQNRIAGKKVVLDRIGNENPSALSFSLVDLGAGLTATTGEQLTASTYISEQFPTGLYGSALPLVMLAKVKAGVDSVDFHVVGDSNAGNPGTGQGWQEGLARGMIRGCCAGMYATGICPVAVHPTASVGILGNASSIGNGGGFKFTNSYIFDGACSDNANIGTVKIFSGNSYAPTDLKNFFDIKGTEFRFAQSVTADFAWLPDSGGLTFTRGETSNSIHEWRGSGLENDGHINTRNAITYRVVHGVQPGSNGSFPLWIHGLSTGTGYGNLIAGFTFFGADGLGVAAYAAAGKRISTAAGATGITASHFTIHADPNRVGVTLSFSWHGYGGGLGGATHAVGPVAVYLESMHGNTKGWAVTGVQYDPGATTRNLAEVIETIGSTGDVQTDSCLRTILKETRERQIQAGGSGNVIVFVNSGVNDVGAGLTSGYVGYINSIIFGYQSTWDSLNYPENDLGFIVTVTHPTVAGDANLSDMRVAGRSLYPKKSNVLFADITQLGEYGITFGGLTSGNSFNSNQSLYESGGTSHLQTGKTGGYAYLAELLVKRCLRYGASY